MPIPVSMPRRMTPTPVLPGRLLRLLVSVSLRWPTRLTWLMTKVATSLPQADPTSRQRSMLARPEPRLPRLDPLAPLPPGGLPRLDPLPPGRLTLLPGTLTLLPGTLTLPPGTLTLLPSTPAMAVLRTMIRPSRRAGARPASATTPGPLPRTRPVTAQRRPSPVIRRRKPRRSARPRT
jgi:hypothetical protein